MDQKLKLPLRKALNGKVTDVTDQYVEGYASVEITDTEGDLIEIDGIDLSLHSPKSPLKLLPSHAKELPDGMPPILGVVTDLRKTYVPVGDQKVKALYFRAAWADNDIARAWKKEYQDGNLDSFSMGAVPIDGYSTQTGTCYSQTKLAEISCVVVPANPLATVARSLAKYLKEEYMETLEKSATPDSYPQLAPPEVQKDMGDEMTMALKSMHEDLQKSIGKALDDHHEKIAKSLKDHQDVINERMDGVECSLAELIGDDEPDDDDLDKKLKGKKGKPQVADLVKSQVEELTKALAALRSSIR